MKQEAPTSISESSSQIFWYSQLNMEVKYVTDPNVLKVYDKNFIAKMYDLFKEMRETIRDLSKIDPELKSYISKLNKYKRPVDPEIEIDNSRYDLSCKSAYYLMLKSGFLEKAQSVAQDFYYNNNNHLDLSVYVFACIMKEKMNLK